MLPDLQMFHDYLSNGGLVALVLVAIAISELSLVFLVFLTLAQISTTARTKPILRDMRNELERLNRLIEEATAREEAQAPTVAPAHPTPSVVPGPGHHLRERRPH